MRTEEEILNDFEKLGYEIEKEENAIGYNQDVLYLNKSIHKIHIKRTTKDPLAESTIKILLKDREYRLNGWSYIKLEEHKLIHELFECWGWL